MSSSCCDVIISGGSPLFRGDANNADQEYRWGRGRERNTRMMNSIDSIVDIYGLLMHSGTSADKWGSFIPIIAFAACSKL